MVWGFSILGCATVVCPKHHVVTCINFMLDVHPKKIALVNPNHQCVFVSQDSCASYLMLLKGCFLLSNLIEVVWCKYHRHFSNNLRFLDTQRCIFFLNMSLPNWQVLFFSFPFGKKNTIPLNRANILYRSPHQHTYGTKHSSEETQMITDFGVTHWRKLNGLEGLRERSSKLKHSSLSIISRVFLIFDYDHPRKMWSINCTFLRQF